MVMNKILEILKSVKRTGLVSVIGVAIPCLSSCGSSSKHNPEALKQIEARSHATRSAYHRDQKARDHAPRMEAKPEAKIEEIRYFQVPIDAHVSEDGLLIESHKLTLEIVQP